MVFSRIMSGSLVLMTLLSGVSLHAAAIRTEVESDMWGQTVLTVISADARSLDHVELPKCDGAQFTFAGGGRKIEYINGKLSRFMTLQYRVNPTKEGTLTVPPFAVQVDGKKIYTEKLTFRVQSRQSRRDPFGMMQEEAPVRVSIVPEILIDKRDYYPGEIVELRYHLTLPEEADVKVLGFADPPKTTGLFSKELNLPFPSQRLDNGKVRWTVALFTVIPPSKGTYLIGGGRLRVTVGTSVFNAETRDIMFAEQRITVKPLPEPVPADFSGAAGVFTLTSDAATGSVPVYGEFPVKLKLAGAGNLFTIKDPVVTESDAWKVNIASGEAGAEIADGALRFVREYTVSFIPLKPGAITPKIHFSVYDPEAGVYRTLATDARTVTVTPATLRESSADSPVRRPLFSVGIILLLVAGSAAAVWFLHKRRPAAVKRTVSEPRVAVIAADPLKSFRGDLLRAFASSDRTEWAKALHRAVTQYQEVGSATDVDLVSIRTELENARYGGIPLNDERLLELKEVLLKLPV